MKRMCCDIPQDVLLRLLRLPEGTKIARMAVVHDSKIAGDAPLRLILESDSFYDSLPDTQVTSISPWYTDCPTPEFGNWWYGYAPPLGHFSYTEKFAKDCEA